MMHYPHLCIYTAFPYPVGLQYCPNNPSHKNSTLIRRFAALPKQPFPQKFYYHPNISLGTRLVETTLPTNILETTLSTKMIFSSKHVFSGKIIHSLLILASLSMHGVVLQLQAYPQLNTFKQSKGRY